MAKSKRIKANSVKKDWKEDCNRLVLYADLMGFSNKVTLSAHNDLKKRLILFNEAWKKKLTPLSLGDHLRSVQFSDSILIVVNGTSFQMFNLITKAAISLMHLALSMEFPLKGAIAQGNFTFDKDNDLFFGLPLVDAYRLEEELYYYGIAVHNTAEATVKAFSDSSKPYAKVPISIKKGKTSHYNLCWNLLDEKLQPGEINDKCEKWLDLIEEGVSGSPRIYVDNTRTFLNETKDKTWNEITEKDSWD